MLGLYWEKQNGLNPWSRLFVKRDKLIFWWGGGGVAKIGVMFQHYLSCILCIGQNLCLVRLRPNVGRAKTCKIYIFLGNVYNNRSGTQSPTLTLLLSKLFEPFFEKYLIWSLWEGAYADYRLIF